MVIEDGNGDGTIDWEDADKYAKDWDGDGSINTAPTPFPVIADYQTTLWKMYRYACDPANSTCTGSCWVTPQHQLVDQGLATVDDSCSASSPTSACPTDGCGWGTATETELRALLDDILPPKWCGEGRP